VGCTGPTYAEGCVSLVRVLVSAGGNILQCEVHKEGEGDGGVLQPGRCCY